MTSEAPLERRGRVHLPGLNPLRSLAAMVVIITHTDNGLRLAGIQKYASLTRLNPESAGLAVLFFFVLSGFLITYLLLVEESTTGRIAVRGFYTRRILRIWPLYYLIVFLAFFVMPQSRGLLPASPRAFYGWKNLLLYLTIFPNFAIPVWFAGHLWSIGVEEQFYLIWPLLMRTVRSRPALILGVIVAYLAGLSLLKALAPRIVGGETARLLVLAYAVSRIDAMAIGALGAWFLFRRVEPVLRVVRSRWTEALTLVLLAALYLRLLKLPRLTYEVYATLFMTVILDVVSNPRALFRHEGRLLGGLGQISYGLYMYHPIIVTSAIVGVALFRGGHGLAYVLLVHFAGMSATILVAAASYRLLERPILERKLHVSSLITGDLAGVRVASS